MNTILDKVKEQGLVDKIYKYKHQMEWADVMNELKIKTGKSKKIYKHKIQQYFGKTSEYKYIELLLCVEPETHDNYRQGWVYTYAKDNKEDYWLMICNMPDWECAKWRINKDGMKYYKWVEYEDDIFI